MGTIFSPIVQELIPSLFLDFLLDSVKVTNFLVDTYEFKIFTGGNNDAGTDSEVMFEMFGEQDVDGDFPSSGMVYPRNLGATFDQGAVDEFQFKTSFLGTITRLNIGHNSPNLTESTTITLSSLSAVPLPFPQELSKLPPSQQQVKSSPETPSSPDGERPRELESEATLSQPPSNG